MGTLLQDLRFGLRMLAKSPGFTAVAVLVLGLGVGANTAIFTLLNAVLLRPPAVEDPSRLVWISATAREYRASGQISFPDYLDYRDGSDLFDGLIAYQNLPFALSGDGGPERLRGQIATGDYFAVLGLKPALGRFFRPEEDLVPDAAPVAVLSHRLWTRRFQADPALSGRAVTINGGSFTVVGVAPAGFGGIELSDEADLWVPAMMHDRAAPAEAGALTQRGHFNFSVVGRLAAGANRARAQAALGAIAARIETDQPETHRGMGISVSQVTGGIRPEERGDIVPIGTLLTIVTSLVLLIACANVANLLLGRGAARRREIGIRLALGASRGRLVRQLLTESVLLAGCGAAAGLILSAWGLDVLLAIAGANEAIGRVTVVDLRVLLYAVAIAGLTGLIFGMAPALNATRKELVPALKGVPIAAAIGSRRFRLQNLFVVAQVALSVVLLVAAGLLLRSVGKAASVPVGFETRNGLTVSFDPALLGYTGARGEQFCDALLERVRSMPGVRSATLASLVPLSGTMIGMGVAVEGADAEAPQPTVFLNNVWPGYFETLGIPLLRGRDFSDRDLRGTAPSIIVNETLAQRLWPGEDPIGRRLSTTGTEGPWREVIGVTADGKYDDLTEEPQSYMYLPYRQETAVRTELALVLRTDGDPSRLAPALQRELREMEADLPLYRMSTLEELVRVRNDKQRGTSAMLAVFGALALLLASMGLYAVVAQAVVHRTREIGVRTALGASRRDIVGLFMREGLRIALVGVGIGLALAAALTRAIAGMLFGITPTDLITFAGVAVLLAGVAAVAAWIPSLRAARVDPMSALRCE